MQVICRNCSKVFNKDLNQIKKTSNNFCSRSCSASYNNKMSPKRKLRKHCAVCAKLIKSNSKYCSSCRKTVQTVSLDNITYGALTYKAKYQKNSKIRQRARSIMESTNTPKRCKNCGYDKHVAVCHIIFISSFPDTALVSEINDLENLVYLCNNCHWELDHGLLDPSVIKS